MNVKKGKSWPVIQIIFLFAVISIVNSFVAGNLNAAGKDEKTIKRFIAEREKELKALSLLNISAFASFNGHTSGDENLYQLGLGVSVSKEMYPGEFQFRTSTSMVIQNSVMQENVRMVSLSYEHYLLSWLETFGFVDRYSNTFLKLAYRYEIGGGFKAEFNLFPNKWKEPHDNSHQVLQKYREYIRLLQEWAGNQEDLNHDTGTVELLNRLLELKRKEKGVMEFAKRKRSLLTIGMAISAFSELEKGENLPELLNDILKERQHYRLSLRPSIVFRPSRLILLKGYYYYKLPLFKRDHPGDPRHYRTDAIISAVLNLSNGGSWAKNIAMVFEYQRHFDNNPFGLRDNTYAYLNLTDGLVKQSHDEFLIKLNVDF